MFDDIRVVLLTPRERKMVSDGLRLLASKMDQEGESDDMLVEVIALRSHVERERSEVAV
jgi:hypothetical protein